MKTETAYTLTSIKGNRTITTTLEGAIKTAISMEEELMPAFGISIVDFADGKAVAEVRDGKAEVEQDAQDAMVVGLIEHPCPECGEVEVIYTTDGLMGTCSCADRPWTLSQAQAS